MALLCDETKTELIPNSSFMAISFTGDICKQLGFEHFIVPLSQEAIKRIPELERSSHICTGSNGDINIYTATSTEYDDRYTHNGLDTIKFLFSISVKTIKKYLPTYYERHEQFWWPDLVVQIPSSS